MDTNNAIVAIVAIFVTVTAVLGMLTISGTAFAQEEKGPGASELTPKENPKIPGWDPGLAPDDAPGKLAPTYCKGCAKESAPGNEGLDSGANGPKK